MIATLESLAVQIAARGLGSLSLGELEALTDYSRWLTVTRAGQKQAADTLAEAMRLLTLAQAQPAEGARPS
ncbi:MAG: hypothetical protein ACREUL_18590 [Steroidobacteraceae bacterium]